LHTEEVEKTGCRRSRLQSYRIAIPNQVQIPEVDNPELLQRLGLIPDVEVVRTREWLVPAILLIRGLPYREDSVGIRIRERAEDDPFQNREDGHVRADGHGDGEDQKSGESRAPEELSYSEPEIEEESVEHGSDLSEAILSRPVVLLDARNGPLVGSVEIQRIS
jgi:hypothetical protein